MTYQVIARKWRPQNFDELIGQEHISKTLMNAFKNNRVGHSFIFIGVRGVGKTTTARILAKRLNCENPNGGNPCNICQSCKDIQNGRHIDVIEIDGASNTGIEDVKSIREASRYRPSMGKYKIYIIDEVHMLSEKAFNALLKTLEEPPEHVKFIFATTDPHKIPITIKSRCQIYDFRSISVNGIFEHLKFILTSENISVEDDALYMISRKAQGSMRDAQSLLDQVISFASNYISKVDVINILGITNSECLFQTVDSIMEHNIESLILQTARLVDSGVNLINYYKELIEHFHTLLIVINVENPAKILQIPTFELDKYKIQAKKFDNSFSKLYEMLVLGFDLLKISQFKKITFEMNLIKMASFRPITPLKDILSLLDKLSNSIEGNQDLGEVKIDIFNHDKIEKNTSTTLSDPKVATQKVQTVKPLGGLGAPQKVQNIKPLEDLVAPQKVQNIKPLEDLEAPQKVQNIKPLEDLEAPQKVQNIKPLEDLETPQKIQNTKPLEDLAPQIKTEHLQILNLEDYIALVKPFYSTHDTMYNYFLGQTKIPLNFKGDKFEIILPLTGEHMLELNPKFQKEFLNWLKKTFGNDIELNIQCRPILEIETYEGIISDRERRADKQEVDDIRNLPNVKKIEEMFNTNVKNIKR